MAVFLASSFSRTRWSKSSADETIEAGSAASPWCCGAADRRGAWSEVTVAEEAEAFARRRDGSPPPACAAAACRARTGCRRPVCWVRLPLPSRSPSCRAPPLARAQTDSHVERLVCSAQPRWRAAAQIPEGMLEPRTDKFRAARGGAAPSDGVGVAELVVWHGRPAGGRRCDRGQSTGGASWGLRSAPSDHQPCSRTMDVRAHSLHTHLLGSILDLIPGYSNISTIFTTRIHT